MLEATRCEKLLVRFDRVSLQVYADRWEGIGYEAGASCNDDINLPRATRRLRKVWVFVGMADNLRLL